MAKTKTLSEYEQDILEIYGIPYRISSVDDYNRPRASKAHIYCPIHDSTRIVRLSNVLEYGYGERYGKMTGTHACKACRKAKRALG